MTPTFEQRLHAIAEAFEALPAPSSAPTSLQIGGYPHYENVLSNYLAFFLNSGEVHGFGPLVAHALFEAAHRRDPALEFDELLTVDAIEARREYPVQRPGFRPLRVDLLLESTERAVVVEHKVFAALYNDLDTYLDVVGAERPEEAPPLGIVLAPRRVPVEAARYVSVGYGDMVTALRPRLGNIMFDRSADARYVAILMEVLHTMDDFAGNNTSDQARREAFVEHAGVISDLFGQFREMQNTVRRRAQRIGEAFRANYAELAEQAVRVWQYQPTNEVIGVTNVDFDMSDWRLSIDASSTPLDTRITVFEREPSTAAALTNKARSALEAAGFDYIEAPDRAEIVGATVSWEGMDHERVASELARVATALIATDAITGADLSN